MSIATCNASDTWTREELLTRGQSSIFLKTIQRIKINILAYFVVVIQVHWACLLICKTRKVSIFTQGMKNMVLNAAMLFETCFAVFIVYTPGVVLFCFLLTVTLSNSFIVFKIKY
jgi:hypothetical protein